MCIAGLLSCLTFISIFLVMYSILLIFLLLPSKKPNYFVQCQDDSHSFDWWYIFVVLHIMANSSINTDRQRRINRGAQGVLHGPLFFGEKCGCLCREFLKHDSSGPLLRQSVSLKYENFWIAATNRGHYMMNRAKHINKFA